MLSKSRGREESDSTSLAPALVTGLSLVISFGPLKSLFSNSLRWAGPPHDSACFCGICCLQSQGHIEVVT